VVRLGLSFKKSGLDSDRKIWQSAHLCYATRMQAKIRKWHARTVQKRLWSKRVWKHFLHTIHLYRWYSLILLWFSKPKSGFKCNFRTVCTTANIRKTMVCNCADFPFCSLWNNKFEQNWRWLIQIEISFIFLSIPGEILEILRKRCALRVSLQNRQLC